MEFGFLQSDWSNLLAKKGPAMDKPLNHAKLILSRIVLKKCNSNVPLTVVFQALVELRVTCCC